MKAGKRPKNYFCYPTQDCRVIVWVDGSVIMIIIMTIITLVGVINMTGFVLLEEKLKIKCKSQ